MAQSFLHELLQTSNHVYPENQDDRKCIICLQETGTMSQETGFIEVRLRLPCNHIVGSGCITTWLQENNTCPICRRVLFAQGQEDEDEEDEDNDRAIQRELCEDYCYQLRLDDRIARIAEMISHNIAALFILNDDSHNSIVTLGIYIASSLSGCPRSPREISMARDSNDRHLRDSCGIDGDYIRVLYGLVYAIREELVDVHILRLLEGRNDLVWPSIGHEMSDGEIECTRDLPAMRKRCAEYCDRLGVTFPIDDLSQHIAANLVKEGFLERCCPVFSKYLFPLEVAAVSIYIASHLIGLPVARGAIQNLIADEYAAFRHPYVRDHYLDIRDTYKIVRDECDEMVDEAFRETLALELNWHSLEADVSEESHHDLQGDRSNNQEDVPLGQITGEASTSMNPRIQRVRAMCTNYLNWLYLTNVDMIEALDQDRVRDHGFQIKVMAQKLGEKIASLETFANHRSQSIAAACVLYACVHGGYVILWEDLRPLGDAGAATVNATYRLIHREIAEGRVDLPSITGSLMESDP